MKTKTFAQWSEKKLDKKINDFIIQGNIEVLDIKFSAAFGYVSEMIIYKDK